MASQETPFCIDCGARLEAGHRFCWQCGAPRWDWQSEPAAGQPAAGQPAPPGQAPPPAEPPARQIAAPPIPGTTVFGQRPQPQPEARPTASLGLLPWFYAAGAVFFLIQATEMLAQVLSPAARSQFATELTRQGFPNVSAGVITGYWLVLIGICLVAAALHGTAFYGLRRVRRWGWIAALIVAAFWSLLIVGIPVLVRLINRNVRQAFGVD